MPATFIPGPGDTRSSPFYEAAAGMSKILGMKAEHEKNKLNNQVLQAELKNQELNSQVLELNLAEEKFKFDEYSNAENAAARKQAIQQALRYKEGEINAQGVAAAEGMTRMGETSARTRGLQEELRQTKERGPVVTEGIKEETAGRKASRLQTEQETGQRGRMFPYQVSAAERGHILGGIQVTDAQRQAEVADQVHQGLSAIGKARAHAANPNNPMLAKQTEQLHAQQAGLEFMKTVEENAQEKFQTQILEQALDVGGTVKAFKNIDNLARHGKPIVKSLLESGGLDALPFEKAWAEKWVNSAATTPEEFEAEMMESMSTTDRLQFMSPAIMKAQAQYESTVLEDKDTPEYAAAMEQSPVATMGRNIEKNRAAKEAKRRASTQPTTRATTQISAGSTSYGAKPVMEAITATATPKHPKELGLPKEAQPHIQKIDELLKYYKMMMTGKTPEGRKLPDPGSDRYRAEQVPMYERGLKEASDAIEAMNITPTQRAELQRFVTATLLSWQTLAANRKKAATQPSGVSMDRTRTRQNLG